jgi:hypothetical protein
MSQSVCGGMSAAGLAGRGTRRSGHSTRTLSPVGSSAWDVHKDRRPGTRGVVTGRRSIRQLPGDYPLAQSANQAPMYPTIRFGPAEEVGGVARSAWMTAGRQRRAFRGLCVVLGAYDVEFDGLSIRRLMHSKVRILDPLPLR